ncbi:hypothetical protein ID866_2074, partial [Astraeus odoratus]
MPRFLDIPLELLAVIFDFVLKPHHLAALCLVSRVFNDFATPILYRRVLIFPWHKNAKSKVTTACCFRCHVITSHLIKSHSCASAVVTDTFLQLLSPNLTNLEQLFIVGCPKVTHRGIEALIAENRDGLLTLNLEALSQSFLVHPTLFLTCIDQVQRIVRVDGNGEKYIQRILALQENPEIPEQFLV